MGNGTSRTKGRSGHSRETALPLPGLGHKSIPSIPESLDATDELINHVDTTPKPQKSRPYFQHRTPETANHRRSSPLPPDTTRPRGPSDASSRDERPTKKHYEHHKSPKYTVLRHKRSQPIGGGHEERIVRQMSQRPKLVLPSQVPVEKQAEEKQWSCPSCSCKNELLFKKCVLCGEPKPIGTPLLITPSTTTTTTGAPLQRSASPSPSFTAEKSQSVSHPKSGKLAALPEVGTTTPMSPATSETALTMSPRSAISRLSTAAVQSGSPVPPFRLTMLECFPPSAAGGTTRPTAARRTPKANGQPLPIRHAPARSSPQSPIRSPHSPSLIQLIPPDDPAGTPTPSSHGSTGPSPRLSPHLESGRRRGSHRRSTPKSLMMARGEGSPVSPRLLSEAATATPRHESPGWACPRCGYTNPLDNLTCGACDIIGPLSDKPKNYSDRSPRPKPQQGRRSPRIIGSPRPAPEQDRSFSATVRPKKPPPVVTGNRKSLHRKSVPKHGVHNRRRSKSMGTPQRYKPKKEHRRGSTHSPKTPDFPIDIFLPPAKNHAALPPTPSTPPSTSTYSNIESKLRQRFLEPDDKGPATSTTDSSLTLSNYLLDSQPRPTRMSHRRQLNTAHLQTVTEFQSSIPVSPTRAQQEAAEYKLPETKSRDRWRITSPKSRSRLEHWDPGPERQEDRQRAKAMAMRVAG